MTRRFKINLFIAISLIVCSIFLYFVPKEYYVLSKKNCDYLYPIDSSSASYLDNKEKNLECKNKMDNGDTVLTFYKKFLEKDPNKCAEEQDARLKEICYFKTAVETKKTKYCEKMLQDEYNDFTISNINNGKNSYTSAGELISLQTTDCIFKLAIAAKDESLCDKVDKDMLNKSCMESLNDQAKCNELVKEKIENCKKNINECQIISSHNNIECSLKSYVCDSVYNDEEKATCEKKYKINL